MTSRGFVRWQRDGWDGLAAAERIVEPAACLAAAAATPDRASRHARLVRLASDGGTVFVKAFPAPGGWRARRAFRMGRALAAAGFGAPDVVVVGRRGREGLLVTRDVGGVDVATAVAARRDDRAAKRALLRALGAEVGRLHAAGFVHGDLVPPNVHLAGDRFVFLDNDRTRRSRILVRLAARRNLVQLGRFVVPGVTVTDRLRVLVAYARARGLAPGARRRLARWLVEKTTGRRCAIDRIAPEAARRAGFRELMRSGGPFDPARTAGETP
jgi:hypothetical protein